MAETPREARHAPETNPTGDEIRDIPRLLAEITRSRLRAANLEAAILAALRAGEDGDIDPLEFLRDELPEIGGRDYA